MEQKRNFPPWPERILAIPSDDLSEFLERKGRTFDAREEYRRSRQSAEGGTPVARPTTESARNDAIWAEVVRSARRG